MIKKIAIALVVATVVGFFGLKFYVARTVSKGLDDFIRSVSIFADVRYQSVTTTMAGKLTIDNLTIQPRGMTDMIIVDGTGLAMPSFLQLLSLDDITPRWLAKEGFPEWFEVFVDRIHVDFEADYYLALLDGPTDGSVPSVEEDPVGHCVLKHVNQGMLAQILGYKQAQYSLAYTFRQLDKAYAIDFRLDAKDLYAVKGTIEIEGRAKTIVQSANYRPSMLGMTVEYEDKSMGARFYERCAELGVDRATADAASSALLWEWLAEIGFVPDERLIAQFETGVIQQHKNARLVLDPTSPIDLSKVQYYKPEDMPALLGVELETW